MEQDGWQTVTRPRGRKHAAIQKKMVKKTPQSGLSTNTPATWRGANSQKPHIEIGAAVADEEEVIINKNPLPIQSPYAKPHQRDENFRSARTILIEHNRQSLTNFTDPLRVEALSCAPTKFHQDESSESTVALTRGRVDEHLRVKLVQVSRGRVSRSTLVCESKNIWVNFSDWLAALEPPKGHIGKGEKATNAQKRWWSKNGKTFPFLRLPHELRQIIYTNLFPTEIYPLRREYQRFKFGEGSEMHDPHAPRGGADSRGYRRLDHTHHVVPRPDVAIMHVNKQINIETEDFMWKATAKSFHNAIRLDGFLCHTLGDPAQYNTLRALTLSFSHREYIYFFKIPLPPFPQIRSIWGTKEPFFGCNDVADKLPSLVHVQEFCMRFVSPFDAAAADPWGYTGEYNPNASYAHYMDWNGNRDGDGFETSCQRVIVEWILTYAFDYVKHFPKVMLGGAIKDSMKGKFDRMFAEEKEGVGHDLSWAKSVIAGLPSTDLPPTCYCTTPCRFWAYYSIAHRDSGCGIPGCRRHYWGRRDEEALVKEFKEYRFDFED